MHYFGSIHIDPEYGCCLYSDAISDAEKIALNTYDI